MSRSHVSVLLFVALELSPSGARAQIEPGSRVRVKAPSVATKTLVGTLTEVDETWLRIELPPCAPRDRSRGECSQERDVTIPRSAVAQLEFSRRRSYRGIGVVAGALTGAVIGIASGQDCGTVRGDDVIARLNRNLCFSRGGLGVSFGLLGALVGAAVAPGEKWEPANADSVQMSVSPLFRRDGMGLAVSFSF